MAEVRTPRGDADEGRKAEDAEFNHVERFRLRSAFMTIIEELRMRRSHDAESERRIQQLVQDRYSLERKLDAEAGKVSSLEEQREADIRDTKRKTEERMRELQIETSQQQVYRKITEKENESLKNEIRSLQLSNYNLDKKGRELERRLNVQLRETDQHLSQISEFETKFKQVSSWQKQVENKQDNLGRNVKEVVKLNRTLIYVNEHQKCVLQMKNSDIKQLRSKLLSARVQEKINADDTAVREQEGEISMLKLKLQAADEALEKQQKECDQWIQKYQVTLKQLEDAHKLLDVNLHTAETYRGECQAAEDYGKELQRQLEQAGTQLEQFKVDLTKAESRYSDSAQAWNQEKSELTGRLEATDQRVREQEAAISGLGESKLEVEERNKDLTEQLNTIKAILNREKGEAGTQTTLAMLRMEERESQTCLEVGNQLVQTDTPPTLSNTTQTIDPAMCSTEMQTNVTITMATGSQTDVNTQVMTTKEIQTEPEFLAPSMRHFEVQTDVRSVEHTGVQTETRVHLGVVPDYCQPLATDDTAKTHSLEEQLTQEEESLPTDLTTQPPLKNVTKSVEERLIMSDKTQFTVDTAVYPNIAGTGLSGQETAESLQRNYHLSSNANQPHTEVRKGHPYPEVDEDCFYPKVKKGHHQLIEDSSSVAVSVCHVQDSNDNCSMLCNTGHPEALQTPLVTIGNQSTNQQLERHVDEDVIGPSQPIKTPLFPKPGSQQDHSQEIHNTSGIPRGDSVSYLSVTNYSTLKVKATEEETESMATVKKTENLQTVQIQAVSNNPNKSSTEVMTPDRSVSSKLRQLKRPPVKPENVTIATQAMGGQQKKAKVSPLSSKSRGRDALLRRPEPIVPIVSVPTRPQPTEALNFYRQFFGGSDTSTSMPSPVPYRYSSSSPVSQSMPVASVAACRTSALQGSTLSSPSQPVSMQSSNSKLGPTSTSNSEPIPIMESYSELVPIKSIKPSELVARPTSHSVPASRLVSDSTLESGSMASSAHVTVGDREPDCSHTGLVPGMKGGNVGSPSRSVSMSPAGGQSRGILKGARSGSGPSANKNVWFSSPVETDEQIIYLSDEEGSSDMSCDPTVESHDEPAGIQLDVDVDEPTNLCREPADDNKSKPVKTRKHKLYRETL